MINLYIISEGKVSLFLGPFYMSGEKKKKYMSVSKHIIKTD